MFIIQFFKNILTQSSQRRGEKNKTDLCVINFPMFFNYSPKFRIAVEGTPNAKPDSSNMI